MNTTSRVVRARWVSRSLHRSGEAKYREEDKETQECTRRLLYTGPSKGNLSDAKIQDERAVRLKMVGALSSFCLHGFIRRYLMCLRKCDHQSRTSRGFWTFQEAGISLATARYCCNASAQSKAMRACGFNNAYLGGRKIWSPGLAPARFVYYPVPPVASQATITLAPSC